MKERIYSWWFLQKGSIRNRIFRLLFLGSLTVFVLLGILVAYGLYSMNSALIDESEHLSDSSAQYIETVTSQQITERLTDVAQSRAYAIETEILAITDNTNYIVNGLESILKNPQDHSPVVLPDPRNQPIRSGEVYVHRGANLYNKGVTPEIQREIELVANVKEYFEPMAKQYGQYESSIFLGSKDGYVIAVDNTPGQDYITITEYFLQSYEPTERGWYKNTQNRGEITFNDIYVGAEGFPSFTCSAPYEDANGFAGVVAIACSVRSISDIIDSAVVGDTGFSFVLNDRGKVMLSTRHEGIMSAETGEDLRKMGIDSLSVAVNKMIEGKKGWQTVLLDGEEYFLAYAPMSKVNWSFGTLIAKKEVLKPAVEAKQNVIGRIDDFRDLMNNKAIQFMLVAIICLWSVLVLLYHLSSWLTGKFVEPIKELTNGVDEIAAGNLEKKISLPTGDELEKLANAFNSMTDELQIHIANLTKVTMEKEHIATELAVATDIQESMLPHIFPFAPEHEEFDIYASMQAAKEVGGDFYDFYMLDDEHLMVTIADVSGKGVPAALFMVIAKTLLKNSALAMEHVEDLANVMARTNDQLCQNNDAMMFVTAFMGVLNLNTGRFSFVNAGHNPPLIYRAKDNKFEYISVERNFVMGGMDGIDFVEQELTLDKDDRLVLYTDGITEALNENKELFGEERLLEALNNANVQEKSVKQLLKDLKQVLNDYVGTAEQSDDMTMLALIYNGKMTH